MPVAFEDIVTDEAIALNSPAATVATLVAAFEETQRSSVRLVLSWDMGSLKGLPRDKLVEFHNMLVAAPNAGLVGSDASRDLVYHIVKRCHEVEYTSAAAAAVGVTAKTAAEVEAEEEKESKGLYQKYWSVTLREVPLDQQARFVSGHLKEVKSNGYISDLPSIERVSVHGTVSGARRKLELGTFLGGESLNMSLDQVVSKKFANVSAVKAHLPALMHGMGALLCTTPITKEAFGGTEDGWVRSRSGGSDQRYLLTIDALEEFMWALVSVHETKVANFVMLVDKAVGIFLGAAAKCRRHPSAILGDMVATKIHLFEPLGARSDASESDVSLTSAGGLGTGGRAGAQMCHDWVLTGSCSDAACTAANHPAHLKGPFVGRSAPTSRNARKRQAAGKQGGRKGGRAAVKPATPVLELTE